MREAVILDAARTPFGKRGKALAEVHPVDLLGGLLARLLEREHVDPALVDDVIIGCVDMVGEQAMNIGRNAWLAAGLPESVPTTTLDRQCGSSLQAIHFAAQGVIAGAYDLVIAGGVESMSRVPMGSCISAGSTPLSSSLHRRYSVVDGMWFDQAKAAEMVARQWQLSREELDQYSLRSHQLAAQAQANNFFGAEIIPVETEHAIVRADEGIRVDASLEKIAALPPAFPGLEMITAANSSQISDGASAMLIATPEKARELGMRPRARFVQFAVVGVDPVMMLHGPIPATQKALQRAGLQLQDIDLFEINEAFAPVVLAWQKELGVPLEKINVNGGAIAIGHPLGASGARLLGTLLHELERRGGRFGLATICEGGGMANATIIERVD